MSDYEDRDPEVLEPHYSKHVHAMTAEGLHSKAAIAAELAFRDVLLEDARQKLADDKFVKDHNQNQIKEFAAKIERLTARNEKLTSILSEIEGSADAYYKEYRNDGFHQLAELAADARPLRKEKP